MRVRGAFSGSELRRLLESWGARPEEFEPEVSTTTLAHNLVKLGCKSYGARELIRRLSNEKPLVEWPELANDDERWAGPMSAPMSLPTASLAEPHATIVMDAPPSDAVVPPSPTLLDATPPPAASVEPAPPSAKAPLSAAFTPGLPSAFSPSPAPEKRVPYLALGGIVFGLLGVAFGVGIFVSRPAAPAAPTSEAAAASHRPARGKSPAGRAAGLVDHALVELGSLCEVDVEGAPNAEVFTLSLEACGRDEVEKLRRLREKEMLVSRSDRDRDPAPTNTNAPLPIVRQPGGPAPKTNPDRQPQPAKAGCRGQCSSSRAACQSDCGAEPTDAARYGAYQSCISRCVSEESRCRLGCR